MKTYKRILAVLLCVVMTLTAAPLSGFVGLELPSLFDFKADATIHIGFGTLDCEVRGDLLIAAGEGEIPDCASPSDVWWSDDRSDVKSAIIGNGITGIGNYVCYGCDNLTTLTISDSVERIGDYVFDGCTKLAEIYYFGTAEEWNNIKIGVGNDALNSAVIHFESAPVISDICGIITAWNLDVTTGELTVAGSGHINYPWEDRPALDWADYALLVESIVIEDGITNIPSYGFADFKNLTSVTIGRDVKYLESYAFDGCDNIKNVYYAGPEDEWDGSPPCDLDIFEGNELLTSANIVFNYVMPENSVASGTCGSNVTWTLSNNGILSISGTGEMHYFDRTPWQPYNEKVRYVIVSDGVTTIGGGAFSDCVNLRVVMLPKSIVTIYEYAFKNCTELTNVFYRGSFSQWDNIVVSTTGNEVLTTNKVSFYGRDESLEIPTTLPYEEPTTVPVTEEPGTVPTTVPPVIPTTTQPVVETTTKAPLPEETTTVPAPSYDYSGTCGDNLTWTLDTETGVLNITGTGEMWDYTYESPAPWSSYSSYIKTVNIASGVTTIGDYAFYDCTNLTSVSIPESVWLIGFSSFECCESLGSVVLPENLQYIYEFAFWKCSSLKTVSIPASVDFIGDAAFADCYSLESITVDSENQYYLSDDIGALYNKEKTTLYQYPIGNTAKTYNIVSSVSVIDERVFACAEYLETVYIPVSVISVGYAAFYACNNLLDIYYNGTQIQWNEISIDDGNYSFDTATIHFKDVDYSGTCGDNLTWTFDPETGVLNITGTGAMKDYTYSSVPWDSYSSYIKTVNIGNGVTTIGADAFYSCGSLTSVTIPDSVTTIGNSAFSWCDSLTSITIPDSVTTIGKVAFYECRSLTSVTIGNSVTTIGDSAFCLCTSLTSVTIPDSVITIGDYAFVRCNNLTSVTIPDSVTTIGERAFSNCTGLKSVTVDSNNKYYSSDSYGVLFNKDKTTLIQYPTGNTRTSYIIPDSVTTIGNFAFYGCDSLTSVTIPDSVTTISDYAFEYCTSLTSVTIGNGVKTIGNYAFYYCTSLTSVTIGNSVTTIGNYAFEYCYSLTSVTIPGSVTTIGKVAFYECRSLTSVTIGNSVTTIGDSAFCLCTSLTSVTIPDSVTTIGEGAFSSCTSLTSVTIGNSVTTIGNYAFKYCTSLTSVTIPDSVITIGDAAFYNCTSLTSVTIPGSVTTIGEDTFQYCYSLTKITVDANNKYYSSDSYGVLFNKGKTKLIQYPVGNTRTSYLVPDSVTTIGYRAFSDCDSLTSVTIGNSVTSIGNYAFQYCDSLTSITIPDSVTTIGSDAFYNCTSLTSVTIPDSVTTIGKYAFSSCTSLKDVYYTGTKTQWENISIGSYNEPLMNATIHWPDKVVSENIDYYIKYGDNDYRGVTINATIADSSFSQDSAVYNHDLARLCSQFTVVGYTSADGNGNDKNTVMKKALKELGFENPNSVVNLSEERTSVNHFITHKKITVNGEEYTLIFMGFIGSYYPQWYNNFDPGEGTTHQGFKSAAISMKLELMKYIKDMNLDKSKTKFLITGHSRGAATANLVAADLIKNEQFALKENVYTYAFATPNSTSLPERNNAEYKRIFNFVNPEDFVTKVLPTTWDYGRYGTTYVLPSRTNTSNYSAYYSNMNPVFKVLTNGENYAPYKNGEEEVYKLVKKFTSTVKSPYDFYNKKMQFNKKDKISPWEFFQIAICPLVGEEDFNTTFFNGLILFATCLLDPTACKTYKEFCSFFLINAVLDKANHMAPAVAKVALSILDPVYGSAINVALATSEGYFEDSHRAETYCAYMMSMTETQIKQGRKGYENTVNCPVDIEVIDNVTGEVVGRIVDNVVDEEIAAKENSIVMDVDGDSKSFWLPSDGDYEVKLIGNGEGTMDYTVAEIDPDLGETERINFFDVEITEGKEMTGDVPAYDFELDEYTLKTDSEEETPDQKLDAESGEITITTSAEGDGYVTNTLTVKSGDYVTLTAQPFVTAKFVKWVDSNGKTLSTDAEYSFVAKGNISIKAVFTTAEGAKIKTPSTTTVNYGDTLILHADFGDIVLPEGYSILWTVEGAGFNMAPAADGLTCNMTSVANGNATVKATLVDENGEAVLDAEGNEMSDTQEIKSNASFWQKIVSFFKNLFRINRTIPE